MHRRGNVMVQGRDAEQVQASASEVLEQRVRLLPDEQRNLLGYAAIQGER